MSSSFKQIVDLRCCKRELRRVCCGQKTCGQSSSLCRWNMPSLSCESRKKKTIRESPAILGVAKSRVWHILRKKERKWWMIAEWFPQWRETPSKQPTNTFQEVGVFISKSNIDFRLSLPKQGFHPSVRNKQFIFSYLVCPITFEPLKWRDCVKNVLVPDIFTQCFCSTH